MTLPAHTGANQRQLVLANNPPPVNRPARAHTGPEAGRPATVLDVGLARGVRRGDHQCLGADGGDSAVKKPNILILMVDQLTGTLFDDGESPTRRLFERRTG